MYLGSVVGVNKERGFGFVKTDPNQEHIHGFELTINVFGHFYKCPVLKGYQFLSSTLGPGEGGFWDSVVRCLPGSPCGPVSRRLCVPVSQRARASFNIALIPRLLIC